MELPLARLRVIDLTEGDAQYCGRYLADLGAQVVLAEPPGGSAGRRDPVVFGLRNANKSSVLLDLASETGQAELQQFGADQCAAQIIRYQPSYISGFEDVVMYCRKLFRASRKLCRDNVAAGKAFLHDFDKAYIRRI